MGGSGLEKTNIVIEETTKDDLDNVMSLWNNGEVMNFVGFPEGLGMTKDKMERWIEWAIAKPIDVIIPFMKMT